MIQTVSGTMPYVFPMGLISLLNGLQQPKLGLFSGEVKAEHLRHARVVVLPVHWFYSIPPAMELARRIKRANRNIRIVSGGYTATLFADSLVQDGAIDVVVRGDADGIFNELVEKLLREESFDHLPNLSFPGGRTPTEYTITPEQYAQSNYRDIGWHPSFHRIAMRSQSISEVSYLYPWIAVARGCTFSCNNCMAAPNVQRKFFKRSLVARPPWAVREDLHYYSMHRGIKHCHFNTDFINTLGMRHAEEILDGSHFDLSCYYEWYRYPTREGVDLLLRSFRRVNLGIFLNPEGQCANQDSSQASSSVERLLELVESYRKNQAVKWILYVDPWFLRTIPAYSKWASRFSVQDNLRINRIDQRVLPPLNHLDGRGLESLYRKLHRRAVEELPGILRRQALISPLFRYWPGLVSLLFRINSRQLKRRIKKMNA
ncbi:MAG: hypothetical protein AB1921_01805 [Thermodesulfobacteriota bacterium]